MSTSIALANNLKPFPINQYPHESFAARAARENIRDFKAIVDLILSLAETENPDYWDAYIYITYLDDSFACSSTGWPEFEIDGDQVLFTTDNDHPLTVELRTIKTLEFSYDT